MARWVIHNDGENVRLTYDDGRALKTCGAGPAALEPSLLAWVVDQAAPGDSITTRHGTFVRLAVPKARN